MKRPDYDLHTARAATLFKVDPKDVTPEQRQAGKRANYFDLYSNMRLNGPRVKQNETV